MKVLILFLSTLLMACSRKANFEAVVTSQSSSTDPEITTESGDIIVISGGTVASTATPFPLHKIALFSDQGEFKKFLYEAPNASTFLYGGSIDTQTQDVLFAIDTVDRVDKIDLESFQVTNAILDANLTGNMRAVESLSDGWIVAADSLTAIEKYSHAGVRAGAPYPLTIPTAINNIKRISGGRFVVTFTTNPDSPRVYNNDGTLAATFPTTSPCTTNCDPYDIVELSDGRFVLNSRVTHGLYLYSSTFVYIGVLYLNTSIVNSPSGMAKLSNGNIIVCNTNFNSCDEFSISGNVGTRVGSSSLIDDASYVRQPLSVMVVP
jgi:hypothetical protein